MPNMPLTRKVFFFFFLFLHLFYGLVEPFIPISKPKRFKKNRFHFFNLLAVYFVLNNTVSGTGDNVLKAFFFFSSEFEHWEFFTSFGSEYFLLLAILAVCFHLLPCKYESRLVETSFTISY